MTESGTASGPERFRIAAVHGSSQGSGCLIAPRLVLTAGHLVKGRTRATVTAVGGLGDIGCRVTWVRHDRECDAALLLAEGPLLPTEHEEQVDWDSLKWVAPLDLETIEGCHATGFPDVGRSESGGLDTEQVVGTLKTGSRLVDGRYAVDIPHTPPAPAEGGGSPWAGMSGAALFAREALVGVVVTDPRRWQHGRLEAVRSHVLLEDREFVSHLVEHAGHKPSLIELGNRDCSRRVDFERRYAAEVAERYSELTVFGLDFGRHDHGTWPLDTAYLSLELAFRNDREHEHDGGQEPSSSPPSGSRRQRVESAFSGERRILLRGLAGSGKTTLVQWLAVTAARQQFPEELGHLRERVPFVLPLRSLTRRGTLPEPGDFLTAANNPLGGEEPAGWAEHVLHSGRGLLLVDGLDEVKGQDREHAQQWLRNLTTLYPDCVYLVTTRPSGVSEGWLSYEGFTEFNLLSMNRQDVLAFVQRWHKAAMQTTKYVEQRARLERCKQHLTDSMHHKNDLAQLATNPLMCAMICALNRDKDADLPQKRLELYGEALDMLLIRRDVQREVGTSDAARTAVGDSRVHRALRRDREAQRLLLQSLAHWMVRNDRVEAARSEALDVVGRTLRSMPQIASPEQADEVLDHLALRCGVLRDPSPESVEFVHRTFQDYLAAKCAVEEQDCDLVIEHAHEPQWEDLVRLTIGHAGSSQRAALLRRLLDLGDQAEPAQRARLHLLAAACLDHATSLAPEVRADIEQRAAALVPPNDLAEAERLAEAGTVALDLIPEPAALRRKQIRPVARAAALLGGERAFQVLRALRSEPAMDVRQELADAWDKFDPRSYAESVLSHLRLDGVRLTVTSQEQLTALQPLAAVPTLRCVGNFEADVLGPALQGLSPRELTIESNDCVSSLEFLTEHVPGLSVLGLADCGGLVDYAALPGLPLESLTLLDMPNGPDLTPLHDIRTLRHVHFRWTRPGRPQRVPLQRLPSHNALEQLTCTGNVTVEGLNGIARWPRLQTAHLGGKPVPAEELSSLGGRSSIRELSVSTHGLCRLKPGDVLPAPEVSDAVMETYETDLECSLEGFRTLFPRLQSLRLLIELPLPGPGQTATSLDLSALTGIRNLSVDVSGPSPTTLKGAEQLPPGSVRVHGEDRATTHRPATPTVSPPTWWRRFGRR